MLIQFGNYADLITSRTAGGVGAPTTILYYEHIADSFGFTTNHFQFWEFMAGSGGIYAIITCGDIGTKPSTFSTDFGSATQTQITAPLTVT
jgi:hypothetical protein